MENLLDDLYNELLEYDIDLEKVLNAGAGEHEFEDVARKLKIEFPEDFVEFYSIANGQDEMADYILYGQELLSLSRIIGEWKIWKDLLDKGTFVKKGIPYKSTPDKGVKDDWWNPLWIPFTYDGAGNHYCIDFDPADGGKVGQIIEMIHDDNPRRLVADSFKDFIKKYIDDLKTGRYIIEL